MSASDQVRFVDRVQFLDGQRLLASDLQALEEYAREMRWLHNRSLHQPGVASGLAVAGAKGDSSLLIQPGYAIDALGRELILDERHVEPVPPIAGDGVGNPVEFDLTVSYAQALIEVEVRAGVCTRDDGAVRLREAPVFCWVRVGDPNAQVLRQQIDTGERILLARVQVLNCQLYQAPSIAQRRDAKPSLHPRVHAEIADVAWEIDDPNFPFGVRLKTKQPVDTRAAGFRTSPAYFVSLVDVQPIDVTDDKGTKTRVALDAFLEVSNAQPGSFGLALLVPRMLFEGSAVDANAVLNAVRDQVESLVWRVEWLGVEG